MHIPSDYYLKLQTLAAAGDLPDTYGVTSQNIARMAPVSMTLDGFMEQYPDLVATVPEACLDAGKYDGSYYCLVNAIDPYGMAINKDIFADAGVEIPERRLDDGRSGSIAAETDQSGRIHRPYRILCNGSYRLHCDYYNFIGNYGGEFFEDGKSTWSTNQGAIDAITMLTNACLNGYAPSPAITTSAGLDNERLFITGQIAMFPGGYWSIKQLLRRRQQPDRL